MDSDYRNRISYDHRFNSGLGKTKKNAKNIK